MAAAAQAEPWGPEGDDTGVSVGAALVDKFLPSCRTSLVGWILGEIWSRDVSILGGW